MTGCGGRSWRIFRLQAVVVGHGGDIGYRVWWWVMVKTKTSGCELQCHAGFVYPCMFNRDLWPK